MPHQQLLTEAQRLSLQAPANDERGMVRHYTLTSEDITLINRRRRDPNRLGFALLLCYLRFPGRILQQGEQPPAELCAFVAGQLGVDTAHFGDYAERDQTRREHVLEIQAALELHPLTRALYRELAAWLLPTALATDHGPTLVATLIEELRTRRIVCPPLPAIERLAGSVRARAQRQLWRRLTDGLTDQQCQSLDQLLEIRAGGGQSTLAWLRQTAYAATTGNFPKLIERLSLIRGLGIESERATRVHQNYWLKLAREGTQTTVQHLAEFEPLRRYATLTALALELTATLTDEALNMFEHLVGQLFKKSERAHAEQFHASGKSINEKVRLYARVGQALIEARCSGGDVFAAIEAVLPWPKFESTVAEARTLAQPEEFDGFCCTCESLLDNERMPKREVGRNPLFTKRWFQDDVIVTCVRWYLRFKLSYRDLASMAAELGIAVAPSTIFRWVIRYAEEFARRWARFELAVGRSWRADETYIKVNGGWVYLYRAVDQRGKTVESYLSRKRDITAAKAFFRRALKHHGEPRSITLDGFEPSHAALRRMGMRNEFNFKWANPMKIRSSKYLNNMVEQDHRRVKSRVATMLGFKSFDHAKQVLVGIELIQKLKKGQYGVPIRFGQMSREIWRNVLAA